jgi:hypothetical protein
LTAFVNVPPRDVGDIDTQIPSLPELMRDDAQAAFEPLVYFVRNYMLEQG